MATSALSGLIEFVTEHQVLIAAIPGAVEGLIDFVEGLVNRGSTDAEKQARLDALASEIRAIAAAYREHPPELPPEGSGVPA